MSRIYGRSSVMKILSNDAKKNIINNKDNYNNLKNPISVFTDKELQYCIEKIIIHYYYLYHSHLLYSYFDGIQMQHTNLFI